MLRIPKVLKPHIKKVADKYGISQEQVVEIEAYMWKFVRDAITAPKVIEEDFKNIYLRFLGNIVFSPGRYSYIQKAKKLKDVKDTGDI